MTRPTIYSPSETEKLGFTTRASTTGVLLEPSFEMGKRTLCSMRALSVTLLNTTLYNDRCQHGGRNVQFDGITLGFQKSRCFLSSTCSAQSGAPIAYGSTFDQRLAIKKKKHRDWLLALVKAKKFQDGLSRNDFEALKRDCRNARA